MGAKKKGGVPPTMLPDHLKALIAFFTLVDKLWCFLKKKHLSCTTESVKGMVQGLAVVQDFDCSLQQVCSVSEGMVGTTEDGVIEFPSIQGTGKSASSRRLEQLSSCLCMFVESRYCAALEADPSLPALYDVLAEGGWPPNAMEVVKGFHIRVEEGTAAPGAKHAKSSTTSSSSLSFSYALGPDGSRTIEELGGLETLLSHLRSQPFYRGQIASVLTRPGRAACYGELESPLPPALSAAISKRLGIDKMYKHQADGINSIRRGKSLVLNTSTASGKSLVYNTPVVESIMGDQNAVALYLFPAKALAQDQLRALELLLGSDLPARAVAVDGDTSERAREAVREGLGNIVLTNPDFLHHTMLPHHSAWQRIFRYLKFVVVDEVHLMRGAFGSHCGCVLRRLLRVCAYYDTQRVQFVFCSATIANPEELVRGLVPLLADMEVIGADREAGPQGERTLLIWNPPLKAVEEGGLEKEQSGLEKEQGGLEKEQLAAELQAQAGEVAGIAAGLASGRRSSISEMSSLLGTLVKSGLRVLAFCRVRKLVELVLKYTSADLRLSAPTLVDRIASYRGGYSKYARREIEQSIFSGRLLGITSTCALELGVDIGNMSATLHLGVPSPTSLDQQVGRCGRAGQASLSIIICFDTPIDQYYARHPDALWSRQKEKCVLDCNNEHILRDHLLCAAAEVPLNYPFIISGERVSDLQIWGKRFGEVSAYLLRNALLAQGSHSALLLPAPPSTAGRQGSNRSLGVSIRHIDPLSITVFDECDIGGLSLDSVGYSRAFYELYEGAVYLCRGRQYEVKKLDLQACTAHARPVSVKYYTASRHDTAVDILKVSSSEGLSGVGAARVVRTVWGYDKKWLANHEVFDSGVCVLPPLQFETRAFWIDIPVSAMRIVKAAGGRVASAIHAANHALLHSALLQLGCDGEDLETEHRPSKPLRLLLFDQRSGGLGTCDELYTQRIDVVRAAIALLQGCLCASDGCPSCVFDARCHSFNNDLSKVSGALLLATLLEQMEEASTAGVDAGAQGGFVEMSPGKRSAQANSLQRERLMEGDRPRKLALIGEWAGQAGVVTDSMQGEQREDNE